MPQASRFWKRRLKVTPDHRRFEKFELLVHFFFFFQPKPAPYFRTYHSNVNFLAEGGH